MTTILRSASVMPMEQVSVSRRFCCRTIETSWIPQGASGFVARESVEVSNVTVPSQAFGEHADSSWHFND